MNPLDYEETMDRISKQEIQSLHFSYPGYAHYRDCLIHWVYQELPALKKRIPIYIEVRLSSSESCRFKDRVNGGLVQFNIKGKNKFTLIEIWDKLEIIEIQ